jgi:hypothetical protein
MRSWPTKYERRLAPIGLLITTVLGITLFQVVVQYRQSLGPNWFIWSIVAAAIPYVLFFGTGFVRIYDAKRASRRVRLGKCTKCDYPVRDGRLQLGDRCTECGFVVDAAILENDLRWRQNRFGLCKPRPDGALYED